MVYLAMNLGAFLCVTLFSLKTGTDEINEYSGLYQKDPFLTLCLSICLLSWAGCRHWPAFRQALSLLGWLAGRRIHPGAGGPGY